MIKKNILWFRAKNYGWGWYPSSWQGWIILSIYLIYLFYRGMETKRIIETIFATILLIIICYLKGEKPEWRWGGKKI
ncbi:MAG: hypothetical protein UR89_C0004G0013 [Candidatus Roizmanbacteria bacterium GW2011_GWA2_35_8]|uniref:Uncharacterized protein n=1 Tax=Candidatus Roizmanbacteria bacterium GW2011_GWA2_35_8 TaxID=1618479 RepID=A0A0G0CYZ5_9BACT|nr:MAG: hypothetical protein UR89_C0004G0013 [Candidatus Roizmanbacteria bacterium GW2011_GWA2_35_8]